MPTKAPKKVSKKASRAIIQGFLGNLFSFKLLQKKNYSFRSI